MIQGASISPPEAAGGAIRPSPAVVPGWVGILCLLVCLVGIVDHDLWTPDEPRDAAIAKDMGRTGNWVVPYLAGEPFVEKPPLYFAVGGAFARVLGSFVGDAGAIRLSSALWGLGTLLTTFLLARRLLGRAHAWLAPAILATMPGFVVEMHWIRVDAALCFFVTAAIWCYAEMYLGGRRGFWLPAGLFAGGAFLVKGPIGPLMIGVALFGILAPRALARMRGDREASLLPGRLAGSALAAILPVGIWLVRFIQVGGPELWRKWFWENQVGRFSGTTPELGHLHPGEPLYYVESALAYASPWIVVTVAWLFLSLRDLRRQRRLDPAHAFMLIWSVGAFGLLSVAITKREVYLAPLLPAFAVMAAAVLAREPARWLRGFGAFWVTVCAVILLCLAALPLAAWLAPSVDRWARMSNLLVARAVFSGFAALACIGIAIGLLRMPLGSRMAAATALLFLGLFVSVMPILDSEKSMRRDVQAFAARIPDTRRPRVGGWRLSETMRGAFGFYCGWTVPPIRDTSRLRTVLEGKDPEFDSIITGPKELAVEKLDVPQRVLEQASPGDSSNKRTVQWVEGLRAAPGGPSR